MQLALRLSQAALDDERALLQVDARPAQRQLTSKKRSLTALQTGQRSGTSPSIVLPQTLHT